MPLLDAILEKVPGRKTSSLLRKLSFDSAIVKNDIEFIFQNMSKAIT